VNFFLFPGQGSQAPGMGKDFFDNSPAAREVFDIAAELSEPGFLDIIFNGTAEQLKDTRVAQVALVACEVAMARHLQQRGLQPSGCAGHSVGEIAALVIAGTLPLEEAIPLTQTRARLMSEDVPEGGMAAVLGMDAADIEKFLPEGAEVANYNGPQQTIISGANAALDAAETALKSAGAKRVMRLPVSGPFHSSYMQAACTRFREILEHHTFGPLLVPVISSVSGELIASPEEARELLWKQLITPVRWTHVMGKIANQNAYEVGPGRVLQGIAKRMENAPDITPVGTFEAAEALEVA
jgi:[acyl-carrier-protein] S-malonyltransferase